MTKPHLSHPAACQKELMDEEQQNTRRTTTTTVPATTPTTPSPSAATVPTASVAATSNVTTGDKGNLVLSAQQADPFLAVKKDPVSSSFTSIPYRINVDMHLYVPSLVITPIDMCVYMYCVLSFFISSIGYGQRQ